MSRNISTRKDRFRIEEGILDGKKRLDAYHEGNGDPDALLLRIIHCKDAPEGGWPSQDIVLDREAARDLFNWLGVWLHKNPEG